MKFVVYMILTPEGPLKDNPRLMREFIILSYMIELYCKRHHQHPTLCNECLTLLALCKRGYEDGFNGTPATYFDPEQQRQMREVMKWAGPRLFFRHPVLAIRYFLDDLKMAVS